MDIFISYSHKDHYWKERVGLFMQCMRRQKHFDYNTWDDSDINISEEWERRIDDAISKAKAAILLISPDFLTSRFILEKEVPLILKRKQEGQLAVVPVIVRPSPWEVVDWLAPIQLHPPGGQALSGGTDYQIEEHLKTLTLEVHRLLKQYSPPIQVDSDARIPGTEAPAAHQFLRDIEIRELIRRQFGENVLDVLLLYEVPLSQNVWIATTRSSVFCLVDDANAQAGGKVVQWQQPITPGMAVAARPKSRLPDRAGTIDIGNRQNWLYSLRTYPEPSQLEARVRAMLETAMRS